MKSEAFLLVLLVTVLSQELTFQDVTPLSSDEDDCRNKATWCEIAYPDCGKEFIKDQCRKYCNICGTGCMDKLRSVLNNKRNCKKLRLSCQTMKSRCDTKLGRAIGNSKTAKKCKRSLKGDANKLVEKFCSKSCKTCINGNWGSWSSFGVCSQKRTRACDSPMPSGGGIPCYGNAEETSICSNMTCPDEGCRDEATWCTIVKPDCAIQWVQEQCKKYCNLCDTDSDDCDPNPCQSGGTCIDGLNTHTCDCMPGFTGENCEIDIDDCDPNPCQNGGTCIDGSNNHTCNCLPGFTGENCEIDRDDCDPNPCQNAGTCIDGVNNHTCDCMPGFMGENCEIDIDECDPNPCRNGGTCIDGVNNHTCDCRPGFTGENCEIGDNLVAVGGWDGSSTLSNIELISTKKDNVNCDPPDLPYAVRDHSTVASDHGLITCGGWDGRYLSKCHLQHKNGSTSSFPSMQSKRRDFGMVIIFDVIYVIGGYPSITKMETMNLKTDNRWTVHDLPFSVDSHCVTRVRENKIVVIGGYDGSNILDTTWVFDVQTKLWEQGPSLIQRRYGHSCFTDEQTKTVFVMGGLNGGSLDTTEKWTIGTNAWEASSFLPEYIFDSAAVSSNSQEYVGYMAGGYTNTDGYTNKIYALRRRDEQWIQLESKSLQQRRSRHTLVNLGPSEIPGC